MRDAQRTREAILDAAERVVVHKGVAHTTVEEVAREASISKGGVLHHFPTKKSILLALLETLITRFEERIRSFRDEDPEPAGAFTRAFLRAATRPETHCVQVFFALSAAFPDTPAMLELHRAACLRWQSQIENDGIDPVQATIVRLATDGLWLARLRGGAILSGEHPNAVIEALNSLTRSKLAMVAEAH
jgi:AcrR family transcriptional regulator